MTSKSAILIAIAGLVLAAVATLWVVETVWPYVPEGEGPWPENIGD